MGGSKNCARKNIFASTILPLQDPMLPAGSYLRSPLPPPISLPTPGAFAPSPASWHSAIPPPVPRVSRRRCSLALSLLSSVTRPPVPVALASLASSLRRMPAWAPGRGWATRWVRLARQPNGGTLCPRRTRGLSGLWADGG